MGWMEWVPAISSSTITGIVAFAGGVYFKAKVERNIQHELDKKLEALRAQMRRDEEAFKAELRSRDEYISTLRSGALTGLAGRQAILDKRRIEAIDRLWTSTVELAKFKLLASMAQSLNFYNAIDAASRQDLEGENTRKFAETIWKSSGLEGVQPAPPPDTERPFLHPLAWALFSAYRQAITYPAVIVSFMRTGADRKLLADPKPLLDTLKAALPHQSGFIDDHGIDSVPFLVSELEDTLFNFIVSNVEAVSPLESGLKQAEEILKSIDKMVPPAPGAVI